jgi:hypothetical protein
VIWGRDPSVHSMQFRDCDDGSERWSLVRSVVHVDDDRVKNEQGLVLSSRIRPSTVDQLCQDGGSGNLDRRDEHKPGRRFKHQVEPTSSQRLQWHEE